PRGTMTVWCAFRKSSTSGLVISPRNTVSGFIGPSSSACSDTPNHPEPVQAQDLLDSSIVIAQVLHRDGHLRIVADVLDFARQFRPAIQVGAQGDVIVADQLYSVVDHPGELVHMHPVFIGDGAAKVQGNRLRERLV